MVTKRAWGSAAALGVTAIVGCAAPVDEAPTAPADEVIGITDLATLEAKLDLRKATAAAPGSARAFEAGACYKALLGTNRGYPAYEARRYANGAAFFAKKGSGPNSSDTRPVLCVDFHQDDVALESLSGVSLDAILRLDLGKRQGSARNTSTGDAVFSFERGVMHFKGLPERDRLLAVTKRPHELDTGLAPSITGSLEKITLKGVEVSSFFLERPEIRDVDMRGELAFLLYRYAWRKGENSGRFTIASDAVGVFQRKADIFGDGGGYSETWRFAHGNGGYTTFSDLGADVDEPGYTESVSFWRGELDWKNGRVPLAECTREGVGERAPSPYRCTGL